jgi:urease gamma subunit
MLMSQRRRVLMNKTVMEHVKKLLQNPQVTVYVSREVYEKIKLIFPGRVKPIY